MFRSDLENLAMQISDEAVRATQIEAIQAWQANKPARSTFAVCPGCGVKNFNRIGRLCPACMETIVKSRIAETRAAARDGDGEMVGIDLTQHWNKYPFVDVDTRLQPDHVFYRSNHDPKREEPAYRCFQEMLHELLLLCLAGFPSMPPGERADPLFQSSYVNGDGGRTAMAPPGFTKAIKSLAFFFPWAIAKAKAEGFERGQNLLGSMADGGRTYDQFAEQIEKIERQLVSEQDRATEMRIRS